MTVVEISKLKAHMIAAVDDDGRRIPQYAIAAECGMSPAMLYFVIKGERTMPPKALEALSDYFDCDPNDLLGTYRVTISDEEGSPR